MAHRMCIAGERDGNFAAYLACVHSDDDEFRYSAFFMAYKLCYEALASQEGQQATAAAARVQKGVNDKLYQDMITYDEFFGPISAGADRKSAPPEITMSTTSMGMNMSARS